MGDPIDFKNNVTEVETNIQNMLDQMAGSADVQNQLGALGLDGIMEGLLEERNYDLREAGLFDDDGLKLNSQEDIQKYIEETKEFAKQCNIVGSRLSHSISEDPNQPMRETLKNLGKDIAQSASHLAEQADLDPFGSDPALSEVVKELNEVRTELKAPDSPNGP